MRILPTITSPSQIRSMEIAELEVLAAEIREAICEQVSRTGGHLTPNLGVVELSIALHYVFDFSHDRLLFDVGHQCYPHKLLTGRLPRFAGLRSSKGMSGFPAPSESAYDLFSVGHAGTGISTAVGMARGDSLNAEAYDPQRNPKGRRVVSLIGDASIVNGVAMEGLNNAGTLKRQFLIVLNDNGMGISKPQGAVAQYFDRLRMSPFYADLKRGAKDILRRVPGGSLVHEAYHKMGEATKAMINEGAWFEHFGIVTVGPIDGHSLPTLIEFLSEAAEFDRPMVLHVQTIKGKGYEFAENDASKFHSPPAFDRYEERGTTNCRVELKGKGRTFTAAFADALADLMTRDDRVVAATAAMPDGTGVSKALGLFPDRVWDTGICESHAMDMMAGMAKCGFKPFLAVYSTFLQRAFDQAFQESALQGLPVRLCLDRAGLVGGDGAVHHGFCDVALLRTLPGACLMAAIDEPSLVAALAFMADFEEGLSAVRYPRDVVSDRFTDRPTPGFELGKARCLTPGLDIQSTAAARPDVAVLAFGTLALDALDAAEALGGELAVGVWDARFAKPVDRTLLTALLDAGVPIVTVEDHSVVGGFGSAVLDAAQSLGRDTSGISRLGIPDAWIHQDPRARQLAQAGLDAAGIVTAIRVAARGQGSHRPAPGAPAKRPASQTIP
jgi:1-deoxy-D-xylulose-5-phosphate synthase